MSLGCGVCRSCHQDRAFLGETYFEAFILPESEGPDLLMGLFIKEFCILLFFDFIPFYGNLVVLGELKEPDIQERWY